MTKATANTIPAADFTDLDTLDTVAGSNAGSEVELVHPTNGKPLGIFIGVLGKHSDVFRETIRERTDNRIRAAAEQAKAGGEETQVMAQEVENRAIELLVACTTHWRSETYNDKKEVIADKSIIKIAGEELIFSVPNAKRLYERFIWMREQVDAGIGDLERFIKA